MSPTLRIVIQMFYPELVSTGQTMTELAEALQREGLSVSVYCGYPTLVDQKSFVPKDMQHQGIFIRRLWSTRFPKLNFFGKLLNHLSFSFSVLWRLLWDREKSPLLFVTNPPFLPIFCAWVCILKRRKYIYLVFDVYPETAIAEGMIAAHGPVAGVWRWLQGVALRHATRVVVIGRCMQRRIQAYGVLPIVHIPVWADDRLIASGRGCSPLEAVLSAHSGKIVVGYSGNIARFHDIETFLSAAEVLRDDSRFVFVFVGDGYKRPLVEAAAQRLPNVVYHDYVPRDRLGDLLASFSIGAVSLLPGREGLSVPSKTYGLLAAGRPVLALVPEGSEIALMVREESAGCVVAPGNVAGVVAALRHAAIFPEQWEIWGRNAKKASQEKYALGYVARAYVDMISSL